MISGYWLENQHVQGVDITAGRVAKLKVEVFGDTFKVCLHLFNELRSAHAYTLIRVRMRIIN
jgi:hypothetical protein